MAKGLRASTMKANRSKLRSKVFGPVEEARSERLAAKLLETASRPKPKADENIRMKGDDKGQYARAIRTCQLGSRAVLIRYPLEVKSKQQEEVPESKKHAIPAAEGMQKQSSTYSLGSFGLLNLLRPFRYRH